MKQKLICSVLALIFLFPLLSFVGCFSDDVQSRGDKSGEVTGSTSAPIDRIASLEEQLDAMRTAQKDQNEAYEARIRDLERVFRQADTPTTDDSADFTYELNDRGVTLTGWNRDGKTLEIPQTINGRTVTAIGDGAFRGKALECVTLPDGILTVGWFAFSGCYRLVSVTVPATVGSIGYGAFEHCDASLRMICPSDSYAAQYAKSYGIPTSGQ